MVLLHGADYVCSRTVQLFIFIFSFLIFCFLLKHLEHAVGHDKSANHIQGP
jgi:hypothetical protein